MSSSFNRWLVRYGFSIGLGIIIVISFLYYAQKQSLESSFLWVLRSSKVQQELTELSRAIQVSNHREVIDVHLQNIRDLIGNSPKQLKHWEEIKSLFDKKEAALVRDGLSYQIRNLHGESFNEQIQMTIEEMRDEEIRLLEGRESLTKKNILLLDLPIVLGGICACLLIYWAYKVTSEELRERIRKDSELQAYTEGLKKSHDTLEIQSNVIGLTVDAMADGLIIINEKGEYLQFNMVAQKLLGFGAKELSQGNGLEMICMRDPITRQRIPVELYPLAQSLRGKSLNEVELIIEPPGEEEHVVSCNSQPVFNKEGRLIGAIAVFRDITQRKTFESELRKAQQTAIETAEMKSRFLANMSHEIRTPMNGIIGMTELLTHTRMDDKQASYVSLINESCRNLLTIINDILDFSKIEAGKLEIEKTDFNLAYTIDRTVQLLVPKAREKNLTLLSYVSPNIPATVRGDSGRVGQILVNLLSNALKFTFSGKVAVKTSLIHSGNGLINVKFTVEDSGVGIDADSIQRLFQPFTQADTSTSRKFGGTGLGLSICKQLVDLMGGEIGVESQLGVGSQFWFTIPFETPFESLESPRRTFPLQTDILVFDQDPDSAQILVDYINSWKIPVHHIKDMKDLKAMIDRPGGVSKYHLMLFSTQGNTSELEQAIAALNRKDSVPQMMIITDNESPEFIERFQNLGVEYFLFRPVQQSSLYNDLIQLLTERGDFNGLETANDESSMAQHDQTLKKGRILLAEDNSTNQLIAQAFLKELGHSVQTVANGKEAMDALKQSEFDLILMDCQMPEMDGFEATQAIRHQMSSRIPIIALTANAMKGDEERCRQAGMNAYLSKPFHKEQLQELLQRYLPKIHPAFDPGRLEMFKDFKDENDGDLRKTLIASYLQNTPSSIADLEKIQAQSSEKFRRLMHTLKSSTASVGGFRLASMFEDLEMNEFENEKVLQKIKIVREEFIKLQKNLEDYASRLNS